MSYHDQDAPISLLIIDDDAVDRRAVLRALRGSDLQIEATELESSAEALAALRGARYDCILLDYQLPGVDGLEVLRQLRATGDRTPVIMLTGQSDAQVAAALMKAGATDYLSKGQLGTELLASSLRSAMRIQRAEALAARHELRLRILAELSQGLAASLDYRAQLATLAQLVVPHLADCCAVDLRESDGQIERIAIACEQPRLAVLGAELLDAAAERADVAADPFARAQAHQGDVAALRVPLIVRGAHRGAISLVCDECGGPFDPEDMVFAEELARRAALAIDNALLYREAHEAVQIRDAFLSVASHELKTPLTSLLGYMDLLKRRITLGATIGERELRRIEVANAQAHRLHKMVASLLDLSRLQTGQLSIERGPVELGALVRRIGDEVEPTLNTHKLRVELPAEPVLISGDELRLEQVIQNLLSNAVKYSPHGGPIALALSAEGGWTRLAVQDQGMGIPRDSLGHVFTRFYRAANSERYQVVGMGVGLFVVKQIAELHGGRIEVDSVEGRGSTFTLWLPLAPPSLDISHGDQGAGAAA